MLDYEGELTVVISKDAKNVQEDKALDYVLGYTSSNDVSARDWQIPEEISGWQFAYAKSFDGFAPVGPCLTSTTLIPDPQQLKYTTKVNGQVRQESSTKNMVFPVKQIIAHLSRGTTIRKGTFIMTGTAAGVGLFVEPKGSGFVKDGDVVEVEFEEIGSIRNKHTFE
jgi:transcription initiation factor TFIIH subunit 2